jgi:glutathione synthase/RimK-type ligase-like ATP-grasp enzyme
MSIPYREIEKLFNMNKESLVKEGLKAFLREKLREIRAEIIYLYAKHEVSSINELDEKINKGKLSEVNTFEDFTRLDYLEYEQDKIRKILEKF